MTDAQITKPSLRARAGAGLRRARRGVVRGVQLAAAGLLFAVRVVITPITFREVMLFAGLGLVSVGLMPIFPPAAWFVPGAVLVAVAIFGVRV